jgi:CubicO group peptidase (beta-lactamase class C family)
MWRESRASPFGPGVVELAAYLITKQTLFYVNLMPLERNKMKHVQSSGIGPPLPHIDEAVQAYLAQTRTPGLAIAVTHDDSIRWARGYGLAELETERLYTTDTLQYSGSVAKTFTTTVALQLWERGLLDLDADIGQYLPYQVRNPYFPDVPITVRQIITHTSSITEDLFGHHTSPYTLAYRTGDPERPGEFAQTWLSVDGVGYSKEAGFYAKWQPGAQSSYANASWLLIADVVEQVTGLSFRQWCKDYIFRPIGMNSSGFYLEDIDVERHAGLYSYVENGQSLSRFGFVPHLQLDRSARPQNSYVRYALYQHPNFPDGGLRTTAYDLALWTIMWLKGGVINGQRILAEATVTSALSPQVKDIPITDPVIFKQGFGWYQRKQDERVTPSEHSWWHGGTDYGALNQVWLDKDTGIGAVIVSNFEAEPAASTIKEFFVNVVNHCTNAGVIH